MMRFYKYHALGNDYIVLPPLADEIVSADMVRRLCRRHTGIGADGVLYGPMPSRHADAALYIYNADGSLSEFSGNGTRIFAQYLKDRGDYKSGDSFSLETAKGVVKGYFQHTGEIYMETGQVRFIQKGGNLKIDDRSILYDHVEIGNPHCVVFSDELDEELTKQYGAKIESHSRFPHRTNVQFVKVIDEKNIEISIYERGSGYTLASGSSSIAAAAVCFEKGLVSNRIIVSMPGGELTVLMDEAFNTALIGEAHFVFEGNI